jgi:hypothetical protein
VDEVQGEVGQLMPLSPEAWTFFSTDSLALIALYRETRRNGKKSARASEKAEATARALAPVSNGFAAQVTRDLAELRRMNGVTMELLTDHMIRHDKEET